MLKTWFTRDKTEAGCDEAGRGCLAGPVVAAAVILPKNFRNKKLNDSKQLTRQVREELRLIIEEKALAFSVRMVDHTEIDRINILNASFKAMHLALDDLHLRPDLLLIDGNRFKPYAEIAHECIVQGDGKYMAIAAASVLAKTYRDAYMEDLHHQFPDYHWITNKGYGTREHRDAIGKIGFSPYHRMSFTLKEMQTRIEF